MKRIFILILFFSLNSSADEVFINYGLGVGPSAVNSMIETKNFDLGYRYLLGNEIFWQNKIGFWDDNSGNPQRSSSAYYASGLGIEPRWGIFEVRTSFGLAAITNTDSYLGGYFPQFNEELGIGIRDDEQTGIGLAYDHFSSAGLYNPNIGRDFVTLEFSVKW